MLGLSKSRPEYDGNKFLVMSGYGYTYSSDHDSHGFGTTQSLLYVYKRQLGFGFDLGYSYTKGGYVNPVKAQSNAFYHTHLHNYFYIGPSVYWFPLNTSRHQIHIGVSVNYSHTNDAELMTSYDPITNSEFSYYQRPSSDGVGLVASAGYTYKITNHIGIGARCYFSWFNEAHVSALFNLSFEF